MPLSWPCLGRAEFDDADITDDSDESSDSNEETSRESSSEAERASPWALPQLPDWITRTRSRSPDARASKHTFRANPANFVKIVPNNPFENPAPWTSYEVFKLVFVGLTLFPVRLLLGILLSLSAFVLFLVASIGLEFEQRDGCYCRQEPLSPWRRRCLAPISWILRGLLWCLGFWTIDVIDQRKSSQADTAKLLVVAPHVTWADALVVSWVLPPFPSGVGDSSLLKAPCGKRCAVASQGIFVNLRDKASKDSCRQILAERASRSTWSGPPTMIFPEGRITNGKMMIQFKLGAFHPGEAVVPVILHYPWKYFNPACCGKGAGALWPIRMMTQFSNTCQPEILEVFEPDAACRADPVVYAHDMRELMSMVAGLETTEHTYDDAFLYRAAQRNNVGTDFEVQNIRKLFDVDLAQLTRWMKVFQEIDKDGDGMIQRDELRKMMSDGRLSHLRVPQSLDNLFDFFDTDGSGSIEYRELIQGLALLAGKCDAESMAKLAFLLYDVEGKGRIRFDVLRSALDNAFAVPRAGCVSGTCPDTSSRRRQRFRSSVTRALERHRADSSPGKQRPYARRPCLGNCGYAATWDTTHCCIACASQPGVHGPTCDQVSVKELGKSPAHEVMMRRSQSAGPGILPPGEAILSGGQDESSPFSADSSQELDFDTFLELTRRRPEILEQALRRYRSRLNLEEPSMNPSASAAPGSSVSDQSVNQQESA